MYSVEGTGGTGGTVVWLQCLIKTIFELIFVRLVKQNAPPVDRASNPDHERSFLSSLPNIHDVVYMIYSI